MKLLEFKNIEELETSLLGVIEKQLKIAIKANDDVLVLLSGGATPINLYKRFNSILDIDWGKVSFGLVDERWLKNDSEQSNFNNIFQALGAEITDNAIFLPMVYNTDDEAKNLLSNYENKIKKKKKETQEIINFAKRNSEKMVFF